MTFSSIFEVPFLIEYSFENFRTLEINGTLKEFFKFVIYLMVPDE
jgi:hypothetical protein